MTQVQYVAQPIEPSAARDLGDRHWHICDNPECQHAWNHVTPESVFSVPFNYHDCPKCGQSQVFKSSASEVRTTAKSAEIINNVQFKS